MNSSDPTVNKRRSNIRLAIVLALVAAAVYFGFILLHMRGGAG